MTTDNTMRHNDSHRGPGAGEPGPPPAVADTTTSTTAGAVPAATRQLRATHAVAWVGWHVLELTAVGVPTVLAVTVDGWWAALAAVVGAGWAGHEIQLTRRHRSAGGETPPTPLLSGENTDQLAGKDRDHDR
ncbi:hypothetical protein [Kibdelosporangium phytohabitans]|uniref:2TM domain-containing protein n=1 Tax=Kibdelosporangium phytohabitans TaxID=860235 RepID=A0A0N9HNI5_9PSEU|nr:hypothetical protein [Kibdelosporangium phytohabitans]ALG05781.1 hypothetical protein AOZ06_01545 [Kibdelosporangium phytohabitans]MBE1466214.1 hypothetical protein [Kibdelosporangium phytohabitans]